MTFELPISGRSASFDFNPRYRCVKNLCHVLTATKVLIFVFIFFWALMIAFKLPVSLTYGFILTIVAACTLFALKEERHSLLWPFVVYSAMFFALTLVTSVVFICLAFTFGQDVFDFFETEELDGGQIATPPPAKEHHMTGAGFFFLAVFIELVVVICTVFCYWQMIIVYRCKEYMEEKYLANMPIIIDDPQSISLAAQQYALANGYDQPPPAYSNAPAVTETDGHHKY